MGAPVDTGIENFEEAILKLSISDRARLIGWISETMVEEETAPTTASDSVGKVEEPPAAWPPPDLRIADNPSGKTPWYGDFDLDKARSPKERKQAADEAWGAWADWAPEDLAAQILAARTISTRELPRYE